MSEEKGWPPPGIHWYYSDGATAIALGDCREILPELEKVDLVVTSPPYGDIRDYECGLKIDLLNVMNIVRFGILPGGVIVWNMADQTINGSETGDSFRLALRGMELGLKLHDTMIYCKEVVTFPDKGRYHPAFEYMFILSDGTPKTFNGITDRRNKWGGTTIHGTQREKDGSMKVPSRNGEMIPELGLRLNWWVIKPASTEERIDHPSRMPMPMAQAHIETWSNPGEVVLDPFMGSGTTLRAAKDLKRRAIGIEIAEKYCEIAALRMRQEVLI